MLESYVNAISEIGNLDQAQDIEVRKVLVQMRQDIIAKLSAESTATFQDIVRKAGERI